LRSFFEAKGPHKSGPFVSLLRCEFSGVFHLSVAVVAALVARPAVVGTPALVERPASAGIEEQGAIAAVARDVPEIAVTDAIGVAIRDVAEEAATDAGPPAGEAVVADESPVQAGFVAARAEPAVEQAASEVAAEAEPDGFGVAGVEWGESPVGRVASAAGLDGCRAGLDEWLARLGDCPDELLADQGE
jgi:hypothetical protein